eukprot:781468-Amphidinium_carterae.1
MGWGPPVGTEAGQDGVESDVEAPTHSVPAVEKDIKLTKAGAGNTGKKNKGAVAGVVCGDVEDTAADGNKEPTSDDEDDDENKKKPTSAGKKTKGKVGKDVKRKEPK